ncbi:hypothetical protein BC629DRAFT_1443425 [Irpex lacteus]|nr:hypothetical protein BC629DRAFT_1443425 [Irpex lacteus]
MFSAPLLWLNLSTGLCFLLLRVTITCTRSSVFFTWAFATVALCGWFLFLALTLDLCLHGPFTIPECNEVESSQYDVLHLRRFIPLVDNQIISNLNVTGSISYVQ